MNVQIVGFIDLSMAQLEIALRGVIMDSYCSPLLVAYEMTKTYQNIAKLYIYIWVNYNISQTWNKAIWGWFPLLTMISSEVAVKSL